MGAAPSVSAGCSVGELAHVVLEHEAHDAEQQQADTQDQQPDGEHQAHDRDAGGDRHRDRPPRVRAEEAVVGLGVLDDRERVVLGAGAHAASREEQVEADEEGQATALEEILADEGIEIIRGAVPTAVRRDPATGEVTVTATTADGSHELRAAELLVATGRRPVTGTLGLDTIGVRAGKRGEVIIDSHQRTTNPRIWAAGDVTAHPQFVYVAAAHGALVADNALTGAGREVDYRHLPRVVFTSPALASVGMTDQQARTAGIRCDSRVLPLAHVPRAIVNRDTRGLIKIVTDADTGRIIGITALAQDAGDLAAAGVYILEAGMTTDQVANLWSPYLTMAEGLTLTAQTFTTDITKLSCCAA